MGLRIRYDTKRIPTDLPDWWADMAMLPIPFEADVGIRIRFRGFYKIYQNTENPDDCNMYSSNDEFLYNTALFDWKLRLFGPYNKIDLERCKTLLPQQYIFYAQRSGDVFPAPPVAWPYVWDLAGEYIDDKGTIEFYIERSIVREMRINDMFIALCHGVPNKHAIIRPVEGELVGRPAIPPIVIYVHDTYSKFSQNGLDPVNAAFGG